jgi:cytochrome c oxidase cbb3-type subunit 3
LLALPLAAACRGRSGDATQSADVPPNVAHEAHVLAGGMAPAAGHMTNPLHQDSATISGGGKIFVAMNCDGCHGDGGTGWVGPSLVDGRWRHGGSDGEVFQSIYFGRPRGMPAYGGLMNANMIWSVITWIRAQPLPPDVPTESWVKGPGK